jgi:hypothetical protein
VRTIDVDVGTAEDGDAEVVPPEAADLRHGPCVLTDEEDEADDEDNLSGKEDNKGACCTQRPSGAHGFDDDGEEEDGEDASEDTAASAEFTRTLAACRPDLEVSGVPSSDDADDAGAAASSPPTGHRPSPDFNKDPYITHADGDGEPTLEALDKPMVGDHPEVTSGEEPGLVTETLTPEDQLEPAVVPELQPTIKEPEEAVTTAAEHNHARQMHN